MENCFLPTFCLASPQSEIPELKNCFLKVEIKGKINVTCFKLILAYILNKAHFGSIKPPCIPMGIYFYAQMLINQICYSATALPNLK